MTTEQEKAYKDLWNAPRSTMSLEEIFCAGWDAAVNNAMPMTADELIYIARQNERDAIEHELLAMVGAAFIAGRYDHAHWFRSLVTVLFKNPGDPSV